jgi:hypothetical protein
MEPSAAPAIKNDIELSRLMVFSSGESLSLIRKTPAINNLHRHARLASGLPLFNSFEIKKGDRQ